MTSFKTTGKALSNWAVSANPGIIYFSWYGRDEEIHQILGLMPGLEQRGVMRVEKSVGWAIREKHKETEG